MEFTLCCHLFPWQQFVLHNIFVHYRDSIDLLTQSMNSKDMKHKSKYEQVLQRRDNEMTLSRFVICITFIEHW